MEIHISEETGLREGARKGCLGKQGSDKLISEARLLKTVTKLSKCYETLVKEFIVNIREDCDDKKSQEFQKVFVRGKYVNFSPAIINKYLGRSEKEEKLSTEKLSVKYAIIHRIGAANWVP